MVCSVGVGVVGGVGERVAVADSAETHISTAPMRVVF